MQYATKMILVPEEVAHRWMNDPRPSPSQVIPLPPSVQGMSRAQQDIQSTLNRQDIPEDVKARMYDQSLGRYLNYFDQYKEALPAPSPSPSRKLLRESKPKTKEETTEAPSREKRDETSEMILSLMPKGLRSKTDDLLRFVKKHGTTISWNERGELLHKGQVLPKTNIVDLMHDVVRQRRSRSSPPPGWREFSEGLREANVPRELIGNRDRWHFMQEPDWTSSPAHLVREEAEKKREVKEPKEEEEEKESVQKKKKKRSSFISTWTSFNQK